jgi:hypothetical protein
MPGMPGHTMTAQVSTWDTLGAVFLVVWAVAMWVAVAGLVYANRNPGRIRVFQGSAAVILIGIVGQIGHLQEHIAQAGYWVAHPNSPAWMTPWGDGLGRGFGELDQSKPTLGMEILHLTGNFIFLAGLAGVVVITHRARHLRSYRWGRMGVWMQGIHGLEHVSLTLSVAFGARKAIGLSTWFGRLDPGAGLVTYRVWWHFLANVLGSYIFSMAVYHLWKERHEVEASFSGAGPAGPGKDAAPQSPSGRRAVGVQSAVTPHPEPGH